ncbi:Response regulator receiver domain-containing protein [Loktanella atrilutea]|uniref:Response regulator receiver domain-containing protein n=1 Tax=Loktanella atrilutea TaxID=366533 RepID=A0A1M5DCZ9_LOKAT|nr:response regulator [Loktanella atrilutea]SHF64820.1 Response regulator receiver domain-containing protein [Loktanella atrilutea]
MKILAVDDDPFILELLTEIIGHVGDHTLQTAVSGPEALEMLHEQRDFDCVMLDYQMPEMNGVEVCRALRLINGYAQTPVMMLTAMSEKRYIDSAFLAGATDYLTKPFDISELRVRLNLIESLVQARRDNGTKLEPTPSGHRASVGATPMSIDKPFEIRDIEGIVDVVALENYVSKLSRARLFGSSVFAISIRRIEQLFLQTSVFDFQCMIVDVAEALSDTLASQTFVAAYAGSGSFVCVVEGARMTDYEAFTDRLNLSIQRLEMHCSNGAPLNVRVSTGQSSRIMWQSGASALDLLSRAVNSAEQEARRVEAQLDDFWFSGATA